MDPNTCFGRSVSVINVSDSVPDDIRVKSQTILAFQQFQRELKSTKKRSNLHSMIGSSSKFSKSNSILHAETQAYENGQSFSKANHPASTNRQINSIELNSEEITPFPLITNRTQPDSRSFDPKEHYSHLKKFQVAINNEMKPKNGQIFNGLAMTNAHGASDSKLKRTRSRDKPQKEKKQGIFNSPLSFRDDLKAPEETKGTFQSLLANKRKELSLIFSSTQQLPQTPSNSGTLEEKNTKNPENSKDFSPIDNLSSIGFHCFPKTREEISDYIAINQLPTLNPKVFEKIKESTKSSMFDPAIIHSRKPKENWGVVAFDRKHKGGAKMDKESLQSDLPADRAIKQVVIGRNEPVPVSRFTLYHFAQWFSQKVQEIKRKPESESKYSELFELYSYSSHTLTSRLKSKHFEFGEALKQVSNGLQNLTNEILFNVEHMISSLNAQQAKNIELNQAHFDDLIKKEQEKRKDLENTIVQQEMAIRSIEEQCEIYKNRQKNAHYTVLKVKWENEQLKRKIISLEKGKDTLTTHMQKSENKLRKAFEEIPQYKSNMMVFDFISEFHQANKFAMRASARLERNVIEADFSSGAVYDMEQVGSYIERTIHELKAVAQEIKQAELYEEPNRLLVDKRVETDRVDSSSVGTQAETKKEEQGTNTMEFKGAEAETDTRDLKKETEKETQTENDHFSEEKSSLFDESVEEISGLNSPDEKSKEKKKHLKVTTSLNEVDEDILRTIKDEERKVKRIVSLKIDSSPIKPLPTESIRGFQYKPKPKPKMKTHSNFGENNSSAALLANVENDLSEFSEKAQEETGGSSESIEDDDDSKSAFDNSMEPKGEEDPDSLMNSPLNSHKIERGKNQRIREETTRRTGSQNSKRNEKRRFTEESLNGEALTPKFNQAKKELSGANIPKSNFSKQTQSLIGSKKSFRSSVLIANFKVAKAANEQANRADSLLESFTDNFEEKSHFSIKKINKWTNNMTFRVVCGVLIDFSDKVEAKKVSPSFALHVYTLRYISSKYSVKSLRERKYKEFIKSVLDYRAQSPLYELFISFIGLGKFYDERAMEVLLEAIKFLNQRLNADIFREMSHSKSPHSLPFIYVLECLKHLGSVYSADLFEGAKERIESLKTLIPELPYKHYVRTEQTAKIIVESFSENRSNNCPLSASEQIFFAADVLHFFSKTKNPSFPIETSSLCFFPSSISSLRDVST